MAPLTLSAQNREGRGLGFFDAIGSGFANYVNFNGRASLSEFWWWQLFNLLASMVLGGGDSLLSYAVLGDDHSRIRVLGGLFSLAMFLPNLAIGVRRLHDTRHSGWWTLIGFTIIGWIPLFVWGVSQGTFGPNEYGPDPLGGQALPGAVMPGAAMAYPVAPTAPSSGIAAEIERLGRLHAQGALSDEEFAAAKAKLLAHI